MARDSFGNQLLPFMKEHLKTLILYPRHHFYASLDTDFQTDVVIMLMVERSLIKAVPRGTEPYTELQKGKGTRKNPVNR